MTATSDRRNWLDQTEGRTLSRKPGRLSEARAAYRGLREEAKISLVEEIVDVRAAELCLAYSALIDISAGYKLKRGAKTGQTRVGRTPCVRFMVKRKWSGSGGQNPREILPKFLFAYATQDGARVLCAVPTDVIAASDFLRVGPQKERVAVTPENPASPAERDDHAYGTITCVVRRRESPAQLFAMSCRHVFSLVADRPGGRFFSANARVGSRDSSTVIGKTSSLRGKLRAGLRFSLDSQLAFADDRAALRRCIDGFRLTGFAQNAAEIPARYWIQSHRGAISATKQEFRPRVDFEINYGAVGIVIHEQLMVGSAATIGGDSGAPCTSEKAGSRILGMHIAGPSGGGTGTVFMIPAWQIMFRANYVGDGKREDWELVVDP